MSMIKTLIHIQLTCAYRSLNKLAASIKACAVCTVWIIETVIIQASNLQESIQHVFKAYPSLVWIFLILYGFSDICYKFFTKEDLVVMNSFIKTRPISIKDWHNFLYLSQLWDFHNFKFLVFLLPFIFSILSFGESILCIVTIYIAHILNAIIVIFIKVSQEYSEE